jgi:predicted kinase
VLDSYKNASADEIPKRLLAFYRSYRACVRAKVAVIRARQQAALKQKEQHDLALQYLNWADLHAADLGAPSVLMVGGLMGSGKSTLASTLANATGGHLLSTDNIRREMLGVSKQPASYGEGLYKKELRNRVYNELICRTHDQLNQNQSIVLDGTFLTKKLREQFYGLCCRHSAKCLCVQTSCPRSIALARLQQRNAKGDSDSEARTELYDEQAHELEPLSPSELAITMDTTQPMSHQLTTVFRKLRDLLFPEV